ncbi:MAG: KEOPS complex subunit Cgi121 [Candidatus Methanoperedens sp.]|nr:KEOPS complex subunit Cgi121 [Candidatus Methanoperedens sp.]MCZ7396605.1 KEOPS complex subunit Cgi121 [Candidatus Methanoperedens sp.]
MIKIFEGTIVIDDTEKFLQRLKRISKEKNIAIQALDADKLAGEEHIRFAVEKAINSFKNGRNIAKDLAKEIMLYAAGTRQINRAMRLGVHNRRNNIALVAVGEVVDFAFNEITPKHVLQYDSSKNDALMDIFNITKEELQAVGEDKIPQLVLERVALVDVIK